MGGGEVYSSSVIRLLMCTEDGILAGGDEYSYISYKFTAHIHLFVDKRQRKVQKEEALFAAATHMARVNSSILLHTVHVKSSMLSSIHANQSDDV